MTRSVPARTPVRLPWGVRPCGVLLFVLLLATGVVGILSTPGEGPATPPVVDLHIGLGVLMIGLAAFALAAVPSLASRRSQAATTFTALATLATATTGTVFLLVHDTREGNVDRILALAALAGAISMIVVGGASGTAVRSAAPPG